MMLACSFLFQEITRQTIKGLSVGGFQALDLWRRNGGESTINALSKTSEAKRAEIFEYLRECPLYDTVSVGDKDYLLVHGGLGNYEEGKKITDYSDGELLWARVFPSTRYSDKFITIVGHTPTYAYGGVCDGRIYKSETWINVDAGAAGGLAPALLRLDDMQEFYVDTEEK